MLKVVRIICIWTYCICCLCGHTQLPTAAAIPYEYFDDHDELFYDLETEQSKAKYDSHLLAQQLRKDQNVENIFSKDFNANAIMHTNEQRDDEEQENDDDDLEPHARAASCFTGGRRYTHGQKVPRVDNCEVCLCMDGEIFCWWEKCDPKKSATQPATVKQEHSTSTSTTSTKSWHHIETSTQTNGRKTNGNQLKQYQQQQQRLEEQEQQLHVESQWKTGNEQVASSQQSWKKLSSNVEKQMEQQKKKKQKAYDKSMQQEEEQQANPQQHVMMLEHKSMSQSNKIFNFPENLPAVLYYDYRTEEHQHHQNLHRQQHLKHQKQLQQQEQYNSKHSDKSSITAVQQEQQKAETSALLFSTDINEHTYAKNDADIDSDILPEPPTKKPKVILTDVGNTANTQTYLSSSAQTLSTTFIKLNDTQEQSTQRPEQSTATTTTTTTVTANTYEYENPDEAFHRWLTSNSNANQSNNDTFYNTDVEGAGIVLQQNQTTETVASMLDTWRSVSMDKHHLHNVLFNGTDNSSSNTTDTNKGILDIDILLTANVDNQVEEQQTELQPDKEKLQQWQQNHQIEQEKRLQKDSIILESDLILKRNQATTTITNTESTTVPASTPEPHCNVMGTYYKIGDVLPQDAGNCLQCVCIDGTSSDRTPRVTCSPHNCPPLVLPDMLDATGY